VLRRGRHKRRASVWVLVLTAVAIGAATVAVAASGPWASGTRPVSMSTGPAAPARPVAVTPPPSAEPLIIPAAARTANPSRLVIDRVGVSADVEDVGLAPDGTLDPPTNVSRVGWYSASSLPGGVGPSVMVGHLDSTSGPGVFARLSELTPGDVVSVVGDDAMSVSYVVTSVFRFPKEQFPSEAVYGASPDAELRLVTCGGPYERGTGYVDNVVVSARATGI